VNLAVPVPLNAPMKPSNFADKRQTPNPDMQPQDLCRASGTTGAGPIVAGANIGTGYWIGLQPCCLQEVEGGEEVQSEPWRKGDSEVAKTGGGGSGPDDTQDAIGDMHERCGSYAPAVVSRLDLEWRQVPGD
jgi:hypothetical protein